jgi:hypothetical protein
MHEHISHSFVPLPEEKGQRGKLRMENLALEYQPPNWEGEKLRLPFPARRSNDDQFPPTDISTGEDFFLLEPDMETE